MQIEECINSCTSRLRPRYNSADDEIPVFRIESLSRLFTRRAVFVGFLRCFSVHTCSRLLVFSL